MWIKEYSKVYDNVEIEALWRIATDIDNWPTWHEDLAYCKLQGTFSVGNYFILKPKGGPNIKIRLTEVINNRKFTDCTKFFGAKMYDTHEFEQIAEGKVRLSSKLVVTGPLKWLWIKLVAKNVAATVPNEIDTLVHLARLSHG